MRNPIRIEEARAARSILYSLVPTCAWLRAFSLAAGWVTRAKSGSSLLSPQRSPQRPRSSPHSRALRHGSALATALLLAISAAGCSNDGGDAARAETGSGDRSPGRAETVGAATSETSPESAEEDRPVIVFLGTSLTAGYGLEEDQAFPALIQQKIDEAALDYRVINAGVSGDTSAGGLRRLAWLLRLPIAVLVLELGANDMLRGQGVEQLRSNLQAILDETREVYPDARFVVAGMRAAPNLGRTYGDAFDGIYPRLAEQYDAAFVPFLLEDVAARRNLNQADGIHPTAEGHALIAARIWTSLEPVLR